MPGRSARDGGGRPHRGRRPHRVRRRLAAAAAVVALLLLAYVVGIAAWAAAGPPPGATDRVPADVGLAAEDVGVHTGDDLTLAAWYVPARDGADGAAVVLLHGSGSSRGAVLDHAAVLAAHGYGVLAVDARGHGASPGRPMRWGWYGDRDVQAAVTALLARPGVERVAVVGLSMGGEEALGAAALDPRVSAVVAEGVTARQADDLAWLSDVYGWRGTVQEGIEAVRTAVAAGLTPAPVPIALDEAVRAMAPRPVLLVVGGAVPDEAHAAERLRAAAPESVTVWEVPGATHTAGLATDPAGWERRVVEFLDAATAP